MAVVSPESWGLPRTMPLLMMRMKAVIPTTIVTSPGRQVSLCPRAMIQERMNGATHAASRSQRRIGKVSQALTEAPWLAPGRWELGLLALVENHGSHSDPS